VTLICFSRAPIDRLIAYKERMGWQFPYVSTHGTEFPFDFGLAPTPEQAQEIPEVKTMIDNPPEWLEDWGRQVGANPEVWSKTALFIMYDENDGFFDHVVSPYPNVGGVSGKSTAPLDDELFEGQAGTPGGSDGVPGPYGLGVRVPMIVVSPWSKGGWVCSETFDHTSLVRFIEARFGVQEPNITPWRRAVCGDLTSAFDFSSRSDTFPALPSVAAYKPTGTSQPPYHPTPPASGSVPAQEAGVRPSRRLGYAFDVNLRVDDRGLDLEVGNRGRLGVQLQARSLTIPGAPFSYTVGAGQELTTALAHPGTYDLSVHGPNGFFRRFAGAPDTTLRVEAYGNASSGKVIVRITSMGSRGRRAPVIVDVVDAHGANRRLEVRGTREITVDTTHAGGWYDLSLTTPSDASFSCQLAGRLEWGGPLTSDPQLGRS
jgi:phospholipase C